MVGAWGTVTRANGLHLFFRWAWDLATHPRLLDCLEDLLGPVILLRHTRIFYKYPQSEAWVGWHQDGITEHLLEGQAPAIWLGLTDATVENGCLRVVPRSHRLGMLSHWSRQTRDDLASSGMTDREPGSADGDDNELSVKLAKVPEGLDAPFDVVMKAGEMSFHHPLALHGSNPNASAGPGSGSRQRIPHLGFTRTATPSPWCGEVLARSNRSPFRVSRRIFCLRKQSPRIAHQAANSCMHPVRGDSRCDGWRGEMRSIQRDIPVRGKRCPRVPDLRVVECTSTDPHVSLYYLLPSINVSRLFWV